jgi:cystathionine beta-lyase
MVFTPVYDYFLDCPKKWNRQCVYSRLLKRNGRYVIDVEDVKGKLERTRLVLLCNPHNPSGQVFTRQELQPLV